MSEDTEREPAPAAAPADDTVPSPPVDASGLTPAAGDAPAEQVTTDPAAPTPADVASPTEEQPVTAEQSPSAERPVSPAGYPPPVWSPPVAPDAATQPSGAPPPVSPFAYPPTADPTLPGVPPPPPPGAKKRGPGGFRSWVPVAVVAAIIGGGIGAGVTALTQNNDNNSDGNVTIHESNASPGAAVLSGNVTIPQLVNKVIPAVVSIDVKSNGNEDQGTGMIITSDGEVITNNHVIELYVQGGGTGSITVTEYGQTKPLPTTLIGYDQTKDVALLKINNASNLPTVTFGNSSKAVVGDAVVAIGNALGLSAGTPTVTQGIVSALGRSVTAGRGGHSVREPAEPDPDRRRHQPRELGRPAHRHVRAGDRHEHRGRGNGERRHQLAEHRLRHPDRHRSSRCCPNCRRAASRATAADTSASTSPRSPRRCASSTASRPPRARSSSSVVSGSPAAKAGLVQGDVIVDIGRHSHHVRRGPAEGRSRRTSPASR